MKQGLRWAWLSAACMSLAVISCQKEVNLQHEEPGAPDPGPGGDKSIVGNWNFVGLTGDVDATITFTLGSDELKTVNSGGFISTNNAGTIEINDSQFIAHDLTYTIDTVMSTETYINGTREDSAGTDFNYVFPVTNSTSAYTDNGNDSLTVENNFVLPTDPTGGGNAPDRVGLKVDWAGDTLLLRLSSPYSGSTNQGGIPGVVDARLDGVMKLTKRE